MTQKQWLLSLFDTNNDGDMYGNGEQQLYKKWLKTHKESEEYAAYVSTVEAQNAQKLAQVLALWKASNDSSAANVASTAESASAKQTAADNAAAAANKPKLFLIVAIAAVLIFLKK